MPSLGNLGFLWAIFAVFSLLSPLSPVHALGKPKLTQKAAELRSRQVSQVDYRLALNLSASDPLFTGQVQLDFVFAPQGADVRIDFGAGEVLGLAINGTKAEFRYDGEAIYLAEQSLRQGGKNTIVIDYRHAYSRDGNGLYRYRDPTDGASYLYTQFEPYAANQMFPCFDQPDLKASYTLSVKAPRDWTVVTAQRELSALEQGEQRFWSFPATAKFSTYIFSLHAGPYQIWEDKSFRYPLRLMARRSMAKRVPVEDWFAVTKRGFDYFERSFASPYPFGKYDQLAVPDFNAGAMENVAAVTFSERFLIDGPRAKSQKEALAATILHELAHMWFGNLVTMRWWNDLWLNESFATFGASLALAEEPGYEDTWLSFARSTQRAYLADQSVTTHPIVGDVPDTEAAGTIFNGITYAKGGAFLRQLRFVIGEEAFTEGLRRYFRQHAFGNTELKDWLLALEQGAGRPLAGFAKSWLETAGPNSLEVKMSCEGSSLKRLTLIQSALPQTPTLREHRALVGFYQTQPTGQVLSLARHSIAYQGPSTEWTPPTGLACPDLIVPNLEDYDYVKVKIDTPSFNWARQSLSELPERSARMQLWNSLAFAVEDQRLALDKFVELFLRQLPREQDYELLRTIEAVYNRVIAPHLAAVPAPLQAKEWQEDLLKVFEQRLQSREASADSKVLFFGSYVALLTLSEKTEVLLSLLEGEGRLGGWSLGQEQRWELVQALSRLQHPKAAQLIVAERTRDRSSLARRQVLMAEASLASYPEKMRMLAPIVAASSPLSAQDRISILSHLFPTKQEADRLRYEPILAKQYPEVLARLEPSVGRAYLLNLLPLHCRRVAPDLLQTMKSTLQSDGLRKSLLQAEETHSRCRKILGLAEEDLPKVRS